MSIFKKFVSFLTLFLLVVSSTSVSFASPRNDKVLNISSIPFSRQYNNLSVSETTVQNFNKLALENLSSFEAVTISRTDLENADKEMLLELIQNGIPVMIYGKSLQLKDIESYFGNFYEELDPESSKNISLIYLTSSSGKIVCGGVIDGSDLLLTNDKTGNKIKAKDIVLWNEKGTEIKHPKHDPIEFVDTIVTDIQSSRQIDTSTKDTNTVTTQTLPSSPEYIKCDWWIDYSGIGKLKAVVYCYLVYDATNTHYWDLLESFTAAPYGTAWYVNCYTTKLDVTYSSEDITDWIDLPDGSSSTTVSLSGGGPSVSYSTSTASQSISASISGKSVQWTSYTSKPIVISSIYDKAYKYEPGIRASNSLGDMAFKRYVNAYFWRYSFNSNSFESYSTGTTYSTVVLPDHR